MATPFAPLLDTDVPYQPTPQLYTPRSTPPPMIDAGGQTTAVAPAPKTKQPMNPVIPSELATMEDRLKESGSGTSTLTTIAAWLSAARGDFKGLTQIEEQKRRTALAKSMAPEVVKVNNMVNSGKWEEAQSYVNQMANSYGQRAPELIPYFDAMAARISKKQEGWENLKGVANLYKETVKEGNVNYPILRALEKAVERRDNLSETSLQGFLTRAGVHVQNLDGRLSITQPQTGETITEMLPAVVKASDLDNFAGNTVASKHGLDLKQLADLRNGREVKADTGEVIKPGSEKDTTIRTQFNALQPINAALEMSKLTSIPPEVTIQLLKDQGLLKVAIRDFGAGTIDKALAGAREQDTEKQIAINRGTEESSYTAVQSTGKLPFDLDSFAEVKEPLTIADVKGSKGRIILLRPEVINNQIKPALAEIEGLALIPQMFEGGVAPTTTGDKLASGVIQRASSYLGYPLDKNVEIRQHAKTILKRAIETVENTPEISAQITGRDSSDLKDLKAYAAGDFKTPHEFIKAAEVVTQRLQQVLRRAVGGMEEREVNVAPTGGKPRTPAEVLAPVISKAKRGTPKGSQITQSGYDEQGKIVIPGELDPELQQKIQRSKSKAIRRGVPVGGSQGALVPNAPTGTGVQPGAATEQPAQPVQKGYNELDAVRDAMKQKRMK